jgi:hypothetical protein
MLGWPASISRSNSARVITVLQVGAALSVERLSHNPLIVMTGASGSTPDELIAG